MCRGRSVWLLGVSLLLLSGCDGDLAFSTGPRGLSIGGRGGTQPAALLGRWQRTILFTDVSGQHSSETTWEFRADGIAIRTVVTKNLTQGFSDVVVSTGRWSASGRTLSIAFTSPPGSLLLDFSVFGNVLTLNGQDFVRIS